MVGPNKPELVAGQLPEPEVGPTGPEPEVGPEGPEPVVGRPPKPEVGPPGPEPEVALEPEPLFISGRWAKRPGCAHQVLPLN